MRIGVAQLNPTVGDIRGNVAKMEQALVQIAADGADLAVFPELYLVGYPPKDLLERHWFIAQVQEGLRQVQELSRRWPDMGILVGVPMPDEQHQPRLRNTAVLVQGGAIIAQRYKALLPTYDVFDEARYFEPAREFQVVEFGGERLGIHICEDAWADSELWDGPSPYDCDPVRALAERGATLFINISASPFSVGKERVRFGLISRHVQRHGVPFLYVNQVGGNDELIFDGRSVCVDGRGRPLAVFPSFEEHVQVIDLRNEGSDERYVPQEEIASVHDALVLGLRDYMRKCGFSRAIIGLSGGIDSSVTCYLAAKALGPENVLGVSMPSPYSSPGSKDDARQLAENLGIEYRVIPISEIFSSYLATLAPHFVGTAPDVAEENIQARIRGNLLMALSNKFGYLVLSTGNKSELSVGYCTLYGDMSGGLAVISDVPKTMVYELARYINRQGPLIPQNSIEKPPSAELRPNQTDQDTLPPYEILDPILHYYVEEMWSVQQITALGFDTETVRWVARTVDRNEYKRKQAAPGLRVTTKAFGVGRRMPIAARFGV
ncbi:MAG: NAD+ synthase [Chloroflexi bacterium]|nr:NAD+ synthase [Chloroflexota bacterium]